MLAIQCLHHSSKRIPNKMFQQLGKAPLYHYGLMRLKSLTIPKLIIGSEPFRAIANYYNITFLPVPNGCNDFIDLAQYYYNYFDDNILLDCNFCCHPFLKLATIQKLISLSNVATPHVFCNSKRNILYREDYTTLNGEGELADTKNNPLYYEINHTIHIFPKPYLRMSRLVIARSLQPIPVEISPLELIDIDTIGDLNLARMCCNGSGSELEL